MPPQLLSRLSRFPLELWRTSKYLLIVSTLALTGCAATTPDQASSQSVLIRNTYLSQTKSDPLGAYLARKELGASYSTSQYPGPARPKQQLASTALEMLGVKYKFGGGTPYTGFDCSGLVIYAAEKSLGLKLPRRSADIARKGQSVKRSELKKGDLVFFNTRGHRNSHVGIYLGNQKFVHAPRTGAVVRIESMDSSYWRKRYNGARRLVASNAN